VLVFWFGEGSWIWLRSPYFSRCFGFFITVCTFSRLRFAFARGYVYVLLVVRFWLTLLVDRLICLHGLPRTPRFPFTCTVCTPRLRSYGLPLLRYCVAFYTVGPRFCTHAVTVLHTFTFARCTVDFLHGLHVTLRWLQFVCYVCGCSLVYVYSRLLRFGWFVTPLHVSSWLLIVGYCLIYYLLRCC